MRMPPFESFWYIIKHYTHQLITLKPFSPYVALQLAKEKLKMKPCSKNPNFISVISLLAVALKRELFCWS